MSFLKGLLYSFLNIGGFLHIGGIYITLFLILIIGVIYLCGRRKRDSAEE